MPIDLEKMRQKAQAAREAADTPRPVNRAVGGWARSYNVLVAIATASTPEQIDSAATTLEHAVFEFRGWINRLKRKPGADGDVFKDPNFGPALRRLIAAFQSSPLMCTGTGDPCDKCGRSGHAEDFGPDRATMGEILRDFIRRSEYWTNTKR